MKGIERLAAVDATTDLWARATGMPMRPTVLVRLIRIGAFGVDNVFGPYFRKLRITENAVHALCLLMTQDDGSAAPSELSELVGTSRANMTRILEELIRLKLVSRTVDSNDGRRHKISITKAGRRRVGHMVPKLVGPMNDAFSGLSQKESDQLVKLLRKLIVSMDQNSRPVNLAASRAVVARRAKAEVAADG